MKKSLVLFIFLLSFIFFVQPADANSKCHSVNGKADAVCTPGVTNPNVTQANIHSTICVSGYTTKIRPATSYTNKLKKQQIKDYCYSDTKMADYEEDHLIPLEIGGNPTDPKNLWPEPHVVTDNKGSFTKDKLENSLHTSVCKGKMTLQVAQNIILANWDSVTFVKTEPTQPIIPTATPTTTVVNTGVSNTSSTTVNQNSATALCNDGTYSYAAHHQGACSKHGGAKEFYN
ncbi:MAG TPA: DUF3761 domain-containing protein [Patescibacteria group bacterium]|nr:DUF3761 domain-containing protein [Patescibacteria group bacterium]